jgi:hypothetical protein
MALLIYTAVPRSPVRADNNGSPSPNPSQESQGSIALTLSANKVAVGGTVTLTATLTSTGNNGPSISGVRVTFTDPARNSIYATTDNSGQASAPYTATAPGPIVLNASASGFNPNPATVTLTVLKTITLTITPNSIPLGASSTLTATVLNPDASPASGVQVRFTGPGSIVLAIVPLTNAQGQTQLVISPPAPGLYCITASAVNYGTDSGNLLVCNGGGGGGHGGGGGGGVTSGSGDTDYVSLKADAPTISDGNGGSGAALFVDNAYTDWSFVPDYASTTGDGYNAVTGHIHLTQKMVPDGQLSKVTVTFDYPGVANWSPPQPGDLGAGFKDYTTRKQGIMRLWGNCSWLYVAPGTSYNAWTDQILSFGTDGDGYTATFFIQGVNAPPDGSTQTITVTVQNSDDPDHKHTATIPVLVLEAHMRAHTGNHTPDSLNPGTSGVDFNIDDNDEKVKFQNGGFHFWYCANQADATLTDAEFENLAPIKIIAPPQLSAVGGQLFLVMTAAGPWVAAPASVYLYQNLPCGELPGGDALAFLKDTTGQNQEQGAASNAIQVLSDGQQVPITDLTKTNYLFKVCGQGATTCTLWLMAQIPGGDMRIVDAVTLTTSEVSNFWTLYSVREGSPAATNFPDISKAYPLDPGRTCSIPLYPEGQFLASNDGQQHPSQINMPQTDPTQPNPTQSVVLVHVHGYWANQHDVETGDSTIFKRLYWTGYRGAFVGFMWQGNDGEIPLSNGHDFFDPNVYHAFQTAPALENFLRTVVPAQAGANAQNIYMSMHSLGNLVGYEALRLHAKRYGGTGPLVNNVLAIEPAIWREAFEEQAPVNYVHAASPPPETGGDAPYYAAGWDSDISYSVDELEKRSWRFWFSQTDIGASVGGSSYHNYASEDEDLYEWMRVNDYVAHDHHYWRHVSSWTPYRRLSNSTTDNHSMERVPALMTARQLPFGWGDLNLPSGCVQNPLAGHDFNAPAKTGNAWPADSHDAFRSQPFPVIYDWYNQFIAAQQAIPIGKEK